jgi:hypothetical protein
VGVALVGGLAVLLACAAHRGPAAHRDPALAVACAGAVLVAAVHALFDFALHLPLYTIALLSLVGLVIPADILAARPVAGGRRIPVVAAAGLAVAVAVTPLGAAMQNLDAPAWLGRASLPELVRALSWAPASWQVWYNTGRRACAEGSDDAAAFGERCIAQATAYDPNNYRLWRELGRLRLSLGDRPGARAAFRRAKELRHWVSVPHVPED